MSAQPIESKENRQLLGQRKLARPLVILLLACLSSYYLWVLFLAAHPNVSTAYRTYYIEKKTLYWAKGNLDLLWPASGIVRAQDKSPYLSRQGWEPLADGKGRGLSHRGGVFFNFDKTPIHPIRIQLTLDQSITEPVYASFDGINKVRLMPLDMDTLEGILPSKTLVQNASLQHLQIETLASLSVTQISIAEMTQ